MFCTIFNFQTRSSVKYYITKLKEKNYLKKQGSSQKGKWVILTKRD